MRTFVTNRTILPALAVLGVTLALVPASAQVPCAGDCDGGGVVTVDEVVRCVNIALGTVPVTQCMAADTDGSESVTVDEVVTAVERALRGCGSTATPMSTASATPSVPATAAVPTPEATPTATADPTSEPVPTERTELLDWLEAGRYLGWPAESGVHASVGPHFGQVRTFVNPILFGSLSAANAMHPQGAAVVKELYGRSGTEVRGWSVMIKTDPDSDGGRNWYFVEVFNGAFFASSFGAGVCVGCHQEPFFGLESRDFILTPFPLQ